MGTVKACDKSNYSKCFKEDQIVQWHGV